MKRLTLAKLLSAFARRRHEFVIRKDLTRRSDVPRHHLPLSVTPITPAFSPPQRLVGYYRAVGRSGREAVRYLQRYRGFFILYDLDVAGWYWYCDLSMAPCAAVQRFQIPLRDQEMFAVDYFVSPQFRGRGVGMGALRLIHHELRLLGYVTAWGAVDAHNRAALACYEFNGLKIVGEQHSWELGSLGFFAGPRVAIRTTPLAIPAPSPLPTSIEAHQHADGCYNAHAQVVCYKNWDGDHVKFLREFVE
jgi:GNAT superfamily N-acetyltransferase